MLSEIESLTRFACHILFLRSHQNRLCNRSSVPAQIKSKHINEPEIFLNLNWMKETKCMFIERYFPHSNIQINALYTQQISNLTLGLVSCKKFIESQHITNKVIDLHCRVWKILLPLWLKGVHYKCSWSLYP